MIRSQKIQKTIDGVCTVERAVVSKNVRCANQTTSANEGMIPWKNVRDSRMHTHAVENRDI